MAAVEFGDEVGPPLFSVLAVFGGDYLDGGLFPGTGVGRGSLGFGVAGVGGRGSGVAALVAAAGGQGQDHYESK